MARTGNFREVLTKTTSSSGCSFSIVRVDQGLWSVEFRCRKRPKVALVFSRCDPTFQWSLRALQVRRHEATAQVTRKHGKGARNAFQLIISCSRSLDLTPDGEGIRGRPCVGVHLQLPVRARAIGGATRPAASRSALRGDSATCTTWRCPRSGRRSGDFAGRHRRSLQSLADDWRFTGTAGNGRAGRSPSAGRPGSRGYLRGRYIYCCWSSHGAGSLRIRHGASKPRRHSHIGRSIHNPTARSHPLRHVHVGRHHRQGGNAWSDFRLGADLDGLARQNH